MYSVDGQVRTPKRLFDECQVLGMVVIVLEQSISEISKLTLSHVKQSLESVSHLIKTYFFKCHSPCVPEGSGRHFSRSLYTTTKITPC